MSISPSLRRLEERLRRETRAEVRFDSGYRGLYATDASIYEIMPLGVAIPRVADDVPALVRIAAEEGVAIVPRGAATSLSGQTIGAALVIDFSKHLARIGVVDRDRMQVRVEPGVVLDHLNAHLAGLGLMFAPDVSTGDRATIGGMIGNNSAGARSLRYGKTVDHVRGLDVVLDDGATTAFEALDGAALESLCASSTRIGALHRAVRDEVAAHADAIRARFPRILRRVSGYNLDEFIPGLPVKAPAVRDDPWRFNLARLIVGSEGTLAVVAGATLRLVRAPAAQGLVVLSFGSVEAALEQVLEILESQPVAVEMLDDTILELAAAQPELSRHLVFSRARPGAVLAAQYYGDGPEEVAGAVDQLARRFEGRAGVLDVRRCLDAASRGSFWKIRKAGLALLMGMVGDAKPVAFVEDTAVAPDRLREYYARFQEIVRRHGTRAACYGHADVGCLHIRPVLDLKSERDVGRMRNIAREVAELVREFGGAMSGEHGDGLARSRWNRFLFGEEVYGSFLRIKQTFDPRGRLNPGKVSAEPAIDGHLRIGPHYHTEEPATTGFDHEAQGGFARAVELCSGVGVCRKTDTGTMCPSYMATRDERDTTRARANALRLVLSGRRTGGFGDEALHEALDLCLQCKACKSECPSNVDMAKLKAEALYQSYNSTAPPLGALAMAHIDGLYRLAAPIAPLANFLVRRPSLRWALEKLAGIDRRRTLPLLARGTLRAWFRRHVPRVASPARGVVVLLIDCFTNSVTPQVGRAAVRVLEAAGYHVRPADVECCGRTAISKGLLDRARELARKNVARLAPLAREGIPILGCEPSCVLAFVDEYRDFRLGAGASVVAARTRLVDDFLADQDCVPDLPMGRVDRAVLLHGHCHQKATVGVEGSRAALERVPGLGVRVLDSGCCGMAGSFGYELGHYEVSVKLAERVILPACRAEPDAVLAAPGFSCRSQVLDLAGIHALHPVEILAEALPGTDRRE